MSDYNVWADVLVFSGLFLALSLMIKLDARRKPARRYHMVDQKKRIGK